MKLAYSPFLAHICYRGLPATLREVHALRESSSPESLSSRPARARTPLGALNGLNRGPRTVREGVSLRFCSLALTNRVRASP